jgi:hypothetical protein
VGDVPEDFKTYVIRLYEHAKKHVDFLANSLQSEEYDTADFLAHIVILDLTKLREIINTQLRFSKKQA